MSSVLLVNEVAIGNTRIECEGKKDRGCEDVSYFHLEYHQVFGGMSFLLHAFLRNKDILSLDSWSGIFLNY